MATSESSSRAHDLVLFGATGFTGKLVAEYIARSAPKELRWAIAGRNRSKLETVKKDLVAIDGSLGDLAILVADGHDVASLDALVPNAGVVCTTVGPFGQHGQELAAACARHGTHYCDITGEVPFIRKSIDENHERAQASRARIVHCCGFDSIPFDLGVHMLWSRAQEDGRTLAWAKGFAGKLKGTFSGGTVASMLALMEDAAKDPEMRRLLSNPYALDPDPRRARKEKPASPDLHGIHFDRDLGRWTAPFVMSAINTRIVRRSNALLDDAYGKHFRYSESMSFAKGPKGLAMASAVTAGLGAFVATAMFAPARELLAKTVLPKAGEGPTKAQRDAGYFEVHLLAEAEPEPGRGDTTRYAGRVVGTSDPGYGETAKMLGQSALCLAQDAARLPERFGVLTPATAMGMRLVERLRDAGMTFAVDRA